MKRKDFLKKTILGSALAAVGFPISRNLFGKEKVKRIQATEALRRSAHRPIHIWWGMDSRS
ncbi:MAG: hypothetical protein IPJ43_03310 [Saprospiraceae bacterium]|nr:hypothetical protein [Saprospiraceae bacterium]